VAKKKGDLPELPETGRFWLQETQRIRLQSPGILKYPARRRGIGVAATVLAVAALAAAMWFLRR
jgi:hypothetical protein